MRKAPLNRENGVAQTSIRPGQEGDFSMASSHSLDTIVVGFHDDHAVANAGLLLPATLAQRLGIEQVVDELVNLGDRPGHHRPGRKVLTLVHALAARADCTDVGRSGCRGHAGRRRTTGSSRRTLPLSRCRRGTGVTRPSRLSRRCGWYVRRRRAACASARNQWFGS
jgi:hypothetical protein